MLCSLGRVGARAMFGLALQQLVVCVCVYMFYQLFCFFVFCICMGLLIYTKVASDNPERFHLLLYHTLAGLSFPLDVA